MASIRASDLTQAEVEAIALTKLLSRAADATICPSEIARQIDSDHWRSFMPEVHRHVKTLVDEGVLSMVHKGQTVDVDNHTGIYRLKMSGK